MQECGDMLVKSIQNKIQRCDGRHICEFKIFALLCLFLCICLRVYIGVVSLAAQADQIFVFNMCPICVWSVDYTNHNCSTLYRIWVQYLKQNARWGAVLLSVQSRAIYHTTDTSAAQLQDGNLRLLRQQTVARRSQLLTRAFISHQKRLFWTSVGK